MNIALLPYGPLSGAETEILREVRDLGFDWIDIQPAHLQSLESKAPGARTGIAGLMRRRVFWHAGRVCT